MANERREFSRVPLALTGELALASGTVSGRIEDISMAGSFLVTDEAAELGSEGPLTMTFGTGPGALILHARARVVRVADAGLGLRLVEVDLESYDHLKGLVLSNAHNHEAARDEIDAHHGLKPK